MFEATRRRRFPTVVSLVAAAAAIAVAAIAWGPVRDRIAGPVLPQTRVDAIYPESPLAVDLALEAPYAPVDAPAALAFADGVALELASWLATTTGTRDVEEGERRLWASDREDLLVLRWATLLRDRGVYARNAGHLSFELAPAPPRYVHPDDLVLLLAHAAWKLDLGMDLVRSPVHDYLEWREPGGSRIRGIEPTAFRQVDAGGAQAHTNELSVGYKLTFDRDHFRSGSGGVKNPDPLPPGAYEVVTAQDLPSELLSRLAARYPVSGDDLDARLGDHPDPAAVAAVFRTRLAAAMRAWLADADGDLAAESSALTQLRRVHGADLPKAPDERAFAAAVEAARGQREAEAADLAAVLRYYEVELEPAERVRSDAEAVALWLDLRARPDRARWDTHIVPLMNRFKDDPVRLKLVCSQGRRLASSDNGTVEQSQELAQVCPRG